AVKDVVGSFDQPGEGILSVGYPNEAVQETKTCAIGVDFENHAQAIGASAISGSVEFAIAALKQAPYWLSAVSAGASEVVQHLEITPILAKPEQVAKASRAADVARTVELAIAQFDQRRVRRGPLCSAVKSEQNGIVGAVLM